MIIGNRVMITFCYNQDLIFHISLVLVIDYRTLCKKLK